MATPSSIVAWEIPWTEEPGGPLPPSLFFMSLRLCQGFSLTGSDLGLPAAVMSVYLPLLWYLTERALGL